MGSRQFASTTWLSHLHPPGPIAQLVARQNFKLTSIQGSRVRTPAFRMYVGHEIISTAILSLPLIQVGHL